MTGGCVHAAAGQPHPFPRHRQHQVRRPGQRNRRRRRQRGRDVQPGQLRRDHLRELPGGIAAQVHRDHVRQQPGQGRVIEPGRQHVLPPLPHRPAERGPPLQPGPVPIEILGGDEHHHRGRLLPVDGRELLGQVLPPQPDLLISVIETAQPPRLQRLRDLLHVVPLRPGERQRHIPPPPQPAARAAIPLCHDGQSPTRRPPSPTPAPHPATPGTTGTHRPATRTRPRASATASPQRPLPPEAGKPGKAPPRPVPRPRFPPAAPDHGMPAILVSGN